MSAGYRSRMKGPGHPAYVPIEDRFWKFVSKSPGCWEWQGNRNRASTKGSRFLPYGRVRAWGKLQLAHRVSWQLTHGPIPDGMVVAHRCDNPPCVRPDHLFVTTPRGNARDKVKKGRSRGRDKLTESDVLAVRRLYASGAESAAGLGERYGVTKSAIAHMVTGRSWRHVGGPRTGRTTFRHTPC